MILLWVITFIYSGLILFLVFGFNKVPTPEEESGNGENSFSVVVPFRDEADNLPFLLESLAALRYAAGKFEIILVDDASTDASTDICRSFQETHSHLDISVIPAIRSTTSPKKDAVVTAVAVSRKDFIVTTDADCVVLPGWLAELDAYISGSGAKLIAGPVHMSSRNEKKKRLLEIFQEIDFLSLQGATIGGFGVDQPFMCNGANLCYERAGFKLVAGFEGNENIASGDDIFLLEKFQKAQLKTGFLKSKGAIVTTLPVLDFKSLVSQRMRWAAKTSGYDGRFGKFVALAVFLMNSALVVGLLAVWSGHFPQRSFLLAFLVKFNVDFYLIFKAAVFFEREKVMKNYFWCSFAYPLFSSYIAVASLLGGYTWKGRRFKK